MQIAFIVLSSFLSLIAAIPYIIDILKGKTKPRIVTWFVWSILTGLAAAASFSDHQYASAILTLCETVETMAVVILGLMKAGELSVKKFDVYCLIGAGFGLLLWWRFNSPAMAVLASVLIDIIGSLPTIKHMWQKPFEETWLTFALSSLSGFFTLLAATDLLITEIASPIDIMVVNGLFVAIILGRRMYYNNRLPNGDSAPPSSNIPLPVTADLTQNTEASNVPPTKQLVPDQYAASPRQLDPQLSPPLNLTCPSPIRFPKLKWQPVIGAESYRIYRDSKKIGSTTDAFYLDTSTANSTYNYCVSALRDGHESPASKTITVIVNQAPQLLGFTLSNQPNAAGWCNKPVTITFAYRAHDNVGVRSCSPPIILKKEGAHQRFSGHSLNYAGVSSTVSGEVNLDLSPPVLGQPLWSENPIIQGANVTLTIPVTDTLSGVASGEYIGSDDPGFGNGTAMDYDGQSLKTSFNTNRPVGHHELYIRSCDNAGNWSNLIPATIDIGYPANVETL